MFVCVEAAFFCSVLFGIRHHHKIGACYILAFEEIVAS